MSPDRELFRAWLARASDDLRIAHLALEEDPPITWAAAYHAQQAAEKALKGAIAAGGIAPAPTHDLVALLRAAGAAVDLRAFEEEAELLNEYAVVPRYPEVAQSYPAEDARKAVEAAERIVAGVEDAHEDD